MASDPAIYGGGMFGRLSSNTPGLFRALSVAVLVAIAISGLTLVLAANTLSERSERVQTNTAPVIVATQGLFASVAEADAAASGVFLSGANEDRAQRRLYEDALVRATGQVEDIARLVGDDPPSHESLQSILRGITQYAGEVEIARLANLDDDPTADAKLRSASAIVQDSIVVEVTRLAGRSQDLLRVDRSAGDNEVYLAIGLTIVVLTLIAVAHQMMARRTRRLINLPLAVAGVLLIAGAAWLFRGWQQQDSDLDVAAERGADSIELAAQIQSAAFQVKTFETIAVVEGVPLATATAAQLAAEPITAEQVERARSGTASSDGLLFDAVRLADGTREHFASAELLTRWQRYVDAVDRVDQALAAGDIELARSRNIGESNDAFNGFNTTVEGVLLDNREQFTAGADLARSRVRTLPVTMFILALLAAVAAMLGFQMRINDYR